MRRIVKKPLQDLLKKKQSGPIEPYTERYFASTEDINDHSSQADRVIRDFNSAMNHFASLNPDFSNASKAMAGMIAYMFTKVERLEEQVETYEVLLGAIFGDREERENLLSYLRDHTDMTALYIVELIDKVYSSQGK